MKKLYRRAIFPNTFTAAAVFVTFLISSAFAQQTLEGVVRIKVSDRLASQLEARNLSSNVSGEVVTGNASLDLLNRQFRVKRFERVFPHTGKNETKHRRYGLHLWYELRTDKTIPVSNVLQSYRSEKQILKAEPVYKKAVIGSGKKVFGPRTIRNTGSPPAALPGASNDPMLASQWHYNNTGQTGGTPGADIKLFDAWKIETGRKDVVIAVTDEGIQADHVDLAANMWVNPGEIAGNNIDDDNNGYVDDVHGYSFIQRTGKIGAGSHGTHVGGTIAAVTNNGAGVAGVAGGSNSSDGVRLMSCAVFHTDSTADGFAEAYVYSADNGAVISQNSWGYMLPGVYESVVLEAIDYFIAEAGKDENGNQTGPMSGGLVIFSAGNDNSDANFYPAFYEPVLAVASSTHQDIKAQYSNFGTWIDITAPGGETYETGSQGVLSTLPGNEYGYFMGTSMACPHVSGVAGLVLSKFARRGFEPEMLRERLLRSVDNIDATNAAFAGQLGAGRINAALALSQNTPIPPEAVTDLSVAGKDVGEITLTWTSPADENDFVVEYDLRYSRSPITDSNFHAAQKVTDIPSPKPPGTPETFSVKNLAGGVVFYFAVRSVDFEGNISPLSNVVSETSALTPSIVVSPASLSESLKTAERSKRTFSIRNEGQGPLKFTLPEPAEEDPFYTAAPVTGVVAAGKEEIVSITFDASGLLTGTYQQDIIIRHNDPEKNQVKVPLTLQVTSNGSPIASLSPANLDFKSVRVGYSLVRTVTIFNEGSEALVVAEGNSNHPDFRTEFSPPLTIAAFSSAPLRIIFSPATTGIIEGIISLQTNDPSTPILEVTLKGEGLEESPIVISPNSFHEILASGNKITRTMVVRNNGSEDRTYRLEIMNNRLATGQGPLIASTSNGRRASETDSTEIRHRRILEKHQTYFAAKPDEAITLLKPMGTSVVNGKSANATGRESPKSVTGPKQYATGFEEFTPGPVGEQHGWHSTNSWDISEGNADGGALHLRGTSRVSGTGQKYAVTPFLFEEFEYPHYTTAKMRINADQAKGVTWQVVPQDPWSYVATRIRFNADGTIDALVIDNDYAFHWKRVPAAKPSGYFELAIEYNSWGSDTSGFPTYYLFINNQHVFSGTGLASGIGQVVFTSAIEATGPVFDVDEFRLFGGEYIPQFMTMDPREGVIPAGQAVNVAAGFDATLMKFGSYEADVIMHLDATDTLVVPAALTVTGEPSYTLDPQSVQMEIEKGAEGVLPLTLLNTGGQPLDYTFSSDVAGMTFAPQSGTLKVRETKIVNIKFKGDPGIYTGKIFLDTDLGPYPMWVNIVVFDSGAVFSAPTELQYDIKWGEITAKTFQVKNVGKNTVGFIAAVPADEQLVSVEPAEATVSDSVAIILTLDGRNGSPGLRRTWLTFQTNDINRRTHRTNITVNVLQDSGGGGKILREKWTGIGGTEISSIPLNSPPDSTGILSLFESPSNTGDNYGTRIRGYIEAPLSGYYTFWIASNDNSELWLGTDEHVTTKKKIASVKGYTNSRQWDKYAAQESQQIYLVAQHRYYIEALHKEGVGTDHLAVGWQLPTQSIERPIPGMRLFPYHSETISEPPRVTILSPGGGETFSAPATIHLEAAASDRDGQVVKVEFFNGAEKLGADIAAPYTFNWKNVAAGNYSLLVKATDNAGAIDTATVNISVSEGQSCAFAGRIMREQWNKVSGTLIPSIPLDKNPSLTETITVFESPFNIGDNYGTRIRGFLCVPASGKYTFWIASNDRSELWLSTDSSPRNKKKIAYVSGYTEVRQWTKYPSQQSIAVDLTDGQKYYIEALHKEAVGTDHMAVGWQLPDGTLERPIPGIRLLPFTPAGNEMPLVQITSPIQGDTFIAPATVEITAEAADSDGQIAKVEFFNGALKLGEDATSPYTFSWGNVAEGAYRLTATATDNGGTMTGSEPVHINVQAMCTASGKITREYWTRVSGNLVSSIPVDTPPDGVETLTIFEAPVNAGTNYGARIRGFICPPRTGNYHFWIASNDHSELWLSTDEDAEKKAKIAFLTRATGERQWDQFVSQKSQAIQLVQGKTYYIEALHKQGVGTDHIAVGWQLPDGTAERPIRGDRLSPVASTSAFLANREKGLLMREENRGEPGPPDIKVYPNPLNGEKLKIVIENLSLSESVLREIEIRQLTGLSVYSQKSNCTGDCSAEIEIGKNMPSGVYLVQVRIQGRIFTEKLLIP